MPGTDRIREEAAFQNARVDHNGGEPRDKFYFLAVPAFDRYAEAIGDVRGLSVLVVGCSNVGVLPLARQGADVTGIDVADEAVQRLNADIATEGLSSSARGMVMDAEDLHLPPASMDLIVCSGVLHHLDVPRAARAFSRVLKPEGKVVMMEPMAWNPAAAAYRLFTPSMRTEFEHPLKPTDVATLKRHFHDVEVDAFALATLLAAPLAYFPKMDPVLGALERMLRPIDRALFGAIPPLRYLGWTSVIVCSTPRAG